MLTKLNICNFKGIASCNFGENDLARINLLIGKNDCGKSSIMEAAYHLFLEFSGHSRLPTIMSRKTDTSYGGSELWYRYRTESPIIVSASFESLDLLWKIELAEQEQGFVSRLSQRVKRVPSEEAYRSLRSTIYQADFSFGSSSGSLSLLDAGEELKKAFNAYASAVSFIDCTAKSQTREIERKLARFKIRGEEQRFGEILSDIYGKGKEWEFLPQSENPDVKRLALKESGQLKYLGDFGDGLRCCVAILGTAMSIRNTAFFIEEIESHQHSGALSKLIRHLVRIARENDLQLFLSTHSKEVWESLSRGVYAEDIDKEKEEFRCLLIEKKQESGEVHVERTDDVQKITKALE